MATTARNVDDIIIKDTHRGLLYEDGVLTKVLEAGRYSIHATRKSFLSRPTKVEILLVDIREPRYIRTAKSQCQTHLYSFAR